VELLLGDMFRGIVQKKNRESRKTRGFRLIRYCVFSGSVGRTRTCDPVVNSHLLCQLSYDGTPESGRQGIYRMRHVVSSANLESVESNGVRTVRYSVCAKLQFWRIALTFLETRD
jgi:hypothetical protein